MKTRTGFVSNSSSSSFILDRRKLTFAQFDRTINHANDPSCDDPWCVDVRPDTIILDTNMDNFDMYHYLTVVLEVPEDAIRRL